VRQSHRGIAASGIAFVLLVILGNALQGKTAETPTPGSAPSEVAAHLAANPPTTSFWIGTGLEVIALLALAVFAVGLWSVLRAAADDGPWPTLALAGGVVAVAIKLGSLAPAYVAYARADEELDPQLGAALLDMNSAAFALTGAGVALMLIGAAAAIAATRALPRWVAYSAAGVSGLLILTLPFAVATGFSPGFMLFMLWVLAGSIAMARDRTRSRTATKTSASAVDDIAEPAR
jgi:hypothetical protein